MDWADSGAPAEGGGSPSGYWISGKGSFVTEVMTGGGGGAGTYEWDGAIRGEYYCIGDGTGMDGDMRLM